MNQSGYSLLLSLFIMLGVGGLWSAGLAKQKHFIEADQSYELELARQALISYAVNYIDHYGAQGAGIGHLPCPDTDAPDASHADPWIRDGPNPPCSRQQVELGWLPRHVNTTGGRYHFHTRSRQRFWYAVSGRFVNNPLSRIVNPEAVGDISMGSYSDIVAVVTVPPLDIINGESQAWWRGNSGVGRFAFTVIRTNDILLPAMRRVADWVLSRLNTNLVNRDESDNSPACELNSELTLLHWLNEDKSTADCEVYQRELIETFATFENVPYSRHWFIRNKWYDYVVLGIKPICMHVSTVVCEFVLEPIDVLDQKITLTLQPTVNSSTS